MDLQERLNLLRDAILCEDAEDLIKALIEEAKAEGLTEDGRTLTPLKDSNVE